MRSWLTAKTDWSPEERRRAEVQRIRDLASWYRKADALKEAFECETMAAKLEQMPLETAPVEPPPDTTGDLF